MGLDFTPYADIIFSVGSILLIVALVPMLLAKEKPPLTASIQTASILTVFAATYIPLHLPFSAITTCVTAACWWTLAIQRIRNGTRSSARTVA